jgi:hypothetical protein
MTAPFTRGHCPGCQATTKHRYLFFADAADGEEELWSICESCFTVFTEREDGSFVQRAATDEERSAVPPPVVWSEEERAEWRELLRQGRADLRAWLQSGCPGLTPELERALAPGTLDRLRQLLDSPGGDPFP